MDAFKPLLSTLQNYQGTLEVVLVALLTVAGEHIFSVVVFRCPCNSWNLSYGAVFLLVPALVLLVLGLILRNKTWKLFTTSNVDTICAFSQVFLQTIITTMVAPVSWITVALLNGSFYECARTGLANMTLFFTDHPCYGKPPQCKSQFHELPCEESSVTLPPSERDAVLEIIRAESQVLGWLGIASAITAALLCFVLARCCSPVNYMQQKFWQVYNRKEQDMLDRYMVKRAEELAERNVKIFFKDTLTAPERIAIPDSMAWETLSSFFHFDKKNLRYSKLQEYVEDPTSQQGDAATEL